MKELKIIIVLCLSAFIFSCESKTYKDIETPVDINAKPTYQKDFKAILTKDCTRCHSEAGNQSQPYLDSYDLAKTATKDGNLLCRMEESCGRLMPPSGKLPQSTIDLIKLWAAQGYAN
jgi:hypothetical protein